MSLVSRLLTSALLVILIYSSSFVFMLTDNVMAAIKKDILIDFELYESLIKKEQAYPKNDALRRQFYNNELIPNDGTNWILFNHLQIPYFQVSQNEMFLNQWIQIRQCTGKNKSIASPNLPSVFGEKDLLKLDKSVCPQWIHESMQSISAGLFILLDLPKNNQRSRIDIQPVFRMYPYHKDGRFAHLNNGVLQNLILSEVEKIKIWIRRPVNIDESVRIVLGLRTDQDELSEIELGSLSFKPVGKIKRYAQYQNGSFQQVLSDETVADFYKVWYNQHNEITGWLQIKNNRPVYAEGWITWYNSDYLSLNKKVNKKKVQRRPLYPRRFPWIQFEKLSLINSYSRQISQSGLWVKKIVVDYDPFFLQLPLDLDDDAIWDIRRQSAIEYRKQMELLHAFRIWRHIHIAKTKGFYDIDSYQNVYLKQYPVK